MERTHEHPSHGFIVIFVTLEPNRAHHVKIPPAAELSAETRQQMMSLITQGKADRGSFRFLLLWPAGSVKLTGAKSEPFRYLHLSHIDGMQEVRRLLGGIKLMFILGSMYGRLRP